MKKAVVTTLTAAVAMACAGIDNPFGENAIIFSPGDAPEKIDAKVAEIFKAQHHKQFGPERYAFMFLPGDYTATKTMEIGYYTQVLGLGRTPDEVKLTNVKTPAALEGNNATCNFWVGIENVMIVDKDNNADPYFNFQWAVSQAAPARRLLVERKSVFDWFYGWASGGYVADTVFMKPAGSYAQQQYYTRNCQFNQGFYGVNWNNFVQGADGNLGESKDNTGHSFAEVVPLASKLGGSSWSRGGATTVIETTDAMREKPFLFVEGGAWKVFAPALRRNSKGVSWRKGDMGKGKVLDLAKDFFVAQAGRDDAKAINAALAKGRNILFAPGVFHVSEPLKVTKAGTILLGIGEATIVPDNAESAIVCADVDGITVAGLIFDSERYSKRLLVVGPKGSKARHRDNPTIIQDIAYRVGGTGKPGKVDACIEINSSDAIIDHTWVWRADHGEHTGWTANTSRNGIIVNGDYVTANGLFVEHFQEYDILWNGEYGKTYFLQNEKCYDPQGNEVWMSHDGTKKGWSAYKVADDVKHHYAVGLGVYDVFINTNGHSVFLEDAVEVPDTPGVLVENVCIVEIARGDGPLVGINHIVNGKGFGVKTGKDSGGGYAVQRLVRYCNGESEVRPDEYKKK